MITRKTLQEAHEFLTCVNLRKPFMLVSPQMFRYLRSEGLIDEHGHYTEKYYKGEWMNDKNKEVIQPNEISHGDIVQSDGKTIKKIADAPTKKVESSKNERLSEFDQSDRKFRD